MSELHEAATELIITAGRVSIDLPMAKAEELSRAINRATNALQADDTALGLLREMVAGMDDYRSWWIPSEISGPARQLVGQGREDGESDE